GVFVKEDTAMLNGTNAPISAHELVNRLGGKWHGRYGTARCPAHDDTHASLSVSERDGKTLVKCHAGCSQDKLITALRTGGLWQDPTASRPKAPRKVGATHGDFDETGELLHQVVRYGPKKKFSQRRPNGNGGWIWDMKGVKPVPYRLPELLEAISNGHTVLIVEGEKDVDNLAKLGIVATCN